MSIATANHPASKPRARSARTSLVLIIKGIAHAIRPFDVSDGHGYAGIKHRLRAPGGRWFLIETVAGGCHCERCGTLLEDEECDHSVALEKVGLL